MPQINVAEAQYKASYKVVIAGRQVQLERGRYVAFSLSIVATAACSFVFSLTLPYLAVPARDLTTAYAQQFAAMAGREHTACLVGVLYAHLTGLNPLDFIQVVAPPHLAPVDILARWIYLPVLGLISLLLSLPTYFDASFGDPTRRGFLAVGAALASLLYVVLLLTYVVDSEFTGQCLCQFNWQGALKASFDLRLGSIFRCCSACTISLPMRFHAG